MYQEDYLDEMLHLTADIAEELLAVKDTGDRVSNDTAEKIARLAELAVSVRLADVNNCNGSELAADSYSWHRQDDCISTSNIINIYENETIEASVEPADQNECDGNKKDVSLDDVSANLEMTEVPVPDENNRKTEIGSCSMIDEEAENAHEVAESAISEEEADANISENASHSQAKLFTARELRNAFTLNDVFLFQRTLFHGSSTEFRNALEEITSFTSINELEDFLSATYGIDVKSPEAEEFIGIVSNFFRFKP